MKLEPVDYFPIQNYKRHSWVWSPQVDHAVITSFSAQKDTCLAWTHYGGNYGHPTQAPLESRWLEISLICSFFFPLFRSSREGPSTPCWESEVSDQVGWVAGWDRELPGLALSSGPHRRTTSGLDSHCYEAAKRGGLGSFLTKDKQELIWTDSGGTQWFLEGFLPARKNWDVNINGFLSTIIWSLEVLIFPPKQTLAGSLLPEETMLFVCE